MSWQLSVVSRSRELPVSFWAPRKLRLPVVLDGFPCCAAALIAQHRAGRLGYGFLLALVAGTRASTMLDLLNARPYFDLGLRLGEGTGAALMIGIIDAAVRLYREMATFGEAGVSDGRV